jgi:ComF family protein
VLQQWTRALLDLLFPPRCQVCGTPDEFPLCGACADSFEVIRRPVCERCGKPLRGPADLAFTCIPCRERKRYPVECVRAFGIYDGRLREAIHGLKYDGKLALAQPLGEMLAGPISDDPRLRAADVLVPVPLHPRRERQRGFNQAEEVARIAAPRVGVPVRRLLLRQRDTQAQTDLDESERRTNVRDAFVARGEVQGLRVLLIDDVVTTGSTLAECARALRGAGASTVCAAAVAITVRDR